VKLAISTGDPAGVGPSISVEAALWARCRGIECTLFGDARQLRAEAEHRGAEIECVGVGEVRADAVALHAPEPSCGALQLAALDAAVAAVRAGTHAALVTAPMSKAAVASSGHAFIGHTEHLARGAGLADDDVTMLFLGPRLKLGLVTTHLAISAVPRAITAARVSRATRHLAEALVALGEGASIAVASLNPHAGEGGLFGAEERDVLAPVCEALASVPPFVSGTIELAGIVPAETALRRAADGRLGGVVCMFHDQATIASKLLDWGQAVNVTWGLPFVRTSVDHGVAYDAARAGTADASGMKAAVAMAARLIR
jgi:4-hydroxythreonine-4-phosphate dehydrogenase